MQAFRGRGETSLLTTPVFKYYKLVLPAEFAGRKRSWPLANGDPLVVEQPVHRGRVVLVATSADPSWTAMPLWPSFVPLVQEIVAWCAAGQLEQRNIMVGEPIEALWPLPAAEAPPSVQSPDGRSHPASFAGRRLLVVELCRHRAERHLRGQFGPPVNRSQTFAVNVDTAESDLAAIEPDELQQRRMAGHSFRSPDLVAGPRRRTAGSRDPRRKPPARRSALRRARTVVSGNVSGMEAGTG